MDNLSTVGNKIRQRLMASRTICRDDLELRVDKRNKIRLYFKGVELTKSTGFSGLVLSAGAWHSLSGAFIKINKIAQHKMRLFIKFRKIPLIQHWIIELAPDGQINWNIEMEVEAPLKLDVVSAGVFFSKHYRLWFDAGAQENRFPHFTENQKICYETNELDFIGFKAQDSQIPPFTFKADGLPFTLTIQNTDVEHSSRALEIRFEEGKEVCPPGLYSYLKASFQFYPDKAILEEGILGKIKQVAQRLRQEELRRKEEQEEEQRKQAAQRLRQEELRRKEEQEVLGQIRQAQQQLLFQAQENERLRQLQEERMAQEARLVQQQEEERQRLEGEDQRKRAEEGKRLEGERRRLEEECRRLEGEGKRVEEERKRQAAERQSQEEKWKEHEERLKMLQEKIKKVYLGPGESTELVVLEEEYIQKDNSIYIYGDSEDLNDKISLKRGDFKKNVAKIELPENNNARIKIGISRFNFFKLSEIAQFCSILMNQRLDLRSTILNPLPLHKLYSNFFDYLKEIKERVGTDRIEFFLEDEKLLNLLSSVSNQANRYNERELLRLLGVISEHAFIGPQTIVLDTFHRCNTNCVHCWIHTPGRKLSEELVNLKMDLALYKNIVDDAVNLLSDEIIIQGDGEPLLDDRFMEMIQYARNKGLKVIFFTNGILLDEKKAQRIIELEVDEIYCSLPAGTDKTYVAINTKQSKETFHKIADNLKKLIWLRNKFRRTKPKLQMTHVIHDLNHHELEEMAKLDVFIGADRVRFYLARLDENIKFLKIKPGHIQVMKNSLKKVTPYLGQQQIELQDNIWFQLENYNSQTGRWSKGKFLKSGCPVGWFFCLILARGELSMCCHLRIVDYLGGKSFKEAWNSASYDKFRNQAKHIMRNKDIVFPNGVKLYDEYCNNCDTHQVILRINELLRIYNLEQFYKGSAI